MSQLWNPFAFGPTGQPAPPAAPPALRVIGQPATAVQLSQAQTVFYRFCSNARLSAVPNPTEVGRLPDGSPYRIVVVGPAATMFLWPAGGGVADKLRGVGVEAVFAGAPALFVLTFLQGRWQVKEVEEFYGGSGLWVGTSGRYLTDDSLNQAGLLITPRHFTPGGADVSSRASDTSVLRGMAYTGGVGEGVGLFTRAGKYALVVPTFGLLADVREAAVLPDSAFADTPDAPAATAEYVTTVGVEVPPGTGLGRMTLKGRGKYSRLRDGSAVLFPVGDGLRAIHDLAADGWLGVLPTTHELQVNLAGSGYSAQLVERAGPGDESWLPGRPGDIYTPWISDLQQSQSYTQGGVVMGPVYFDKDSTVASGPYTWSYSTLQQRRLALSREQNWERPVYLARRWNDQLVVMTVEQREQHEVTVNRELAMDYTRTSITEGGIMYPPPSYTPITYEPEWTGEFAPQYLFGTADFPGGEIERKDAIRSAYRLVTRRELKTPWGVLKLVDQDVTCTITTVDETPDQHSVQIEIGGRGVYREIRFIDPVLAIVAFVEITAGGYETIGYTVGTVGSTAKFVLQHAGTTLLAFDLANPDEGYVGVGDDPFRHVRGIEAPDGELNKIHDPWLLAFPGQYYDAHAELPGTTQFMAMADVGEFHYSYSSSESRLVQSYPLSPIAPRPMFPAARLKVTVRAAVDPNSGGGVVVVHDDTTFKGGWAIAPSGAISSLAALLARNGGTPEHIQKLVVSV